MTGLQQSSSFSHRRHGAVLVEFAVVALLLYLVIAGIFTFGKALFVAQALQTTADTFAHELARTPLPPGDSLADALQDPAVTQTLFNPDYLEIDISSWIANDQSLSLDQYLQRQGVPLINRLLTPLMIVDQRENNSTVLWYPGAVKDATGNYFVNVLQNDNSILRVPVIEPASDPDAFSLGMAAAPGSTIQPSGLAGVRINYPFQSVALSLLHPDGPGNSFVEASESPDFNSTRGGLYGGPSQLGQQIVGPKLVRPYQRLISAQAVYRREVFGAEPTTQPSNP